MSESSDDQRQEIRGYTVGYVLALALTIAAYAAVQWPGFGPSATIAIIFGLALVQTIVHFRFFLHISLKKSRRDDLHLILFSALVIILMVSGTLVILLNLRHRMM